MRRCRCLTGQGREHVDRGRDQRSQDRRQGPGLPLQADRGPDAKDRRGGVAVYRLDWRRRRRRSGLPWRGRGSPRRRRALLTTAPAAVAASDELRSASAGHRRRAADAAQLRGGGAPDRISQHGGGQARRAATTHTASRRAAAGRHGDRLSCPRGACRPTSAASSTTCAVATTTSRRSSGTTWSTGCRNQ